MEKIPKVYCLTLPGSIRQSKMKKQFLDLELPYEFVYGKIWSADEVPVESVCGSATFININNDWTFEYLRRIYGCKEGHIRLLEKALLDGDDYIISCEDDVLFGENFIEFINEVLQDEEFKKTGICNLNGTYSKNAFDWEDKLQKYKHLLFWGSDMIYILNKKGMRFYLDGLKNCNNESDVGLYLYSVATNNPIPVASPYYSPVRTDPSTAPYSNINVAI